MGARDPMGRGDMGSNPQPKHAIANCCQLVNTNEDLDILAIAIPPFTKALWHMLNKGTNL